MRAASTYAGMLLVYLIVSSCIGLPHTVTVGYSHLDGTLSPNTSDPWPNEWDFEGGIPTITLSSSITYPWQDPVDRPPRPIPEPIPIPAPVLATCPLPPGYGETEPPLEDDEGSGGIMDAVLSTEGAVTFGALIAAGLAAWFRQFLIEVAKSVFRKGPSGADPPSED